jgi:hypothetical protein
MKKILFGNAIKITLLLFLTFAGKLNAQVQPPHEKKMYVDSLNRIYNQTSLPLYLFISNNPNGANPVGMSQNYSDLKHNDVQPMYLDGDGKHHIKHYDEIEKIPVTFVIYADGKAPKTTHIFENSVLYTKDTKKYYGNNQKIKLTAKDDLCGTDKIYYSINSEEYKQYTEPFALTTQGDFILKYYSVDYVGNVENIHTENFSIDNTPPTTFYTINGISDNNIISVNTVIYFNAEDNSTGISKTYYRIDNGTDVIYYPGKIPVKSLEEGTHTIYFHSVDNTGNVEAEKSYEFFLDKTAPIVATDILGDKFIIGNQTFFSGRTKLKLTSVDNKSGVKEVKYSINGSPFNTYTEAFYLPSKKGLHLIDYYAIDNLDNRTLSNENGKVMEYQHYVGTIYVDLTGPSLTHKIIGKQLITRDTIFINSETKIELAQTDAESGPQKIAYTINNSPEEINYSEPISFKESGFHELNQIGYDNVNNRNFKTLNFVVDNKAPEIFYKFSVNPISKTDSSATYPSFVSIFLAPQDDISGIESIYFSINNLPKKQYTSGIKGFSTEAENTVKIEVTDNLGNIKEEVIKFFIEK